MNFRLVSTLIFTLAASVAVTPALAATTQCPASVDVRNLMTVTQYNRAGLNKLDKKQLAALNAWLSRYIEKLCSEHAVGVPPPPPRNTSTGVGTGSTNAGSKPPSAPPEQTRKAQGQAASTATNTAQASNFGNPPKSEQQESNRVESRIVGEFHGWTGNTIFRLENGQIWKQAGPGFFRINLKNPKVVIKKLLIGYVLKVNGYGKEVFVRRIR
ncbi:MAG: hypothetical protein ACRESR_00960 [Gammaproteobacteria bacterium]